MATQEHLPPDLGCTKSADTSLPTKAATDLYALFGGSKAAFVINDKHPPGMMQPRTMIVIGGLIWLALTILAWWFIIVTGRRAKECDQQLENSAQIFGATAGSKPLDTDERLKA